MIYWVYDLSPSASSPIPAHPIEFAQCKFANQFANYKLGTRLSNELIVRSCGGVEGLVGSGQVR